MMPRAKKSYGQNWLVDETVVRKIIDAAEIVTGETVLEVGPGTGILTQALVDAGANVIAVEADKSLIAPLREKFGDTIELIHGDIFSFTFSPPHLLTPFKLISNIPYNITSDLLRRFLTQDPRPSRMVLMLQREVADRIVAVPPKMSLLSVMCQLYAHCHRVANVPAGAFRPIPKVDSAVVQLDIRLDSDHIRTDRPLCGQECEDVMALAKVGFSSRRKQLHGNLKSFKTVTSQQVKDALVSLGIPQDARAEVLTVENWTQLASKLSPSRGA